MISNPSTGEPLEVRNSRFPAEPESFSLNAQWGERYVVGVDLGQMQDYTAFCVIRRVEEDGHKPVFQVAHLSRLPLGTTYPAIVAHVAERMVSPQLRGKAELVIDMTGVGRPVYDLFREFGLSPIGVCITGGSAITNTENVWNIPKGHLVSRIQALLHDGRLKIHKDLPDAPALVSELQDFRINFTESGYATFNARSGKHDDLVLALAIGLWRAHGDHSSFDAWQEFMKKSAGRSVATGRPKLPSQLVRLTAPAGTTTVYTITGRSLNVSDDGTLELDDHDARPLLQAGWKVAASGFSV
jgi:Terminase RNaseH-like domain